MYILKIRVLTKSQKFTRAGEPMFTYKCLASNPFFHENGAVEPGTKIVYCGSKLNIEADDQKLLLVHVSINEKGVWISGLAA